jgi:hypothetical protein
MPHNRQSVLSTAGNQASGTRTMCHIKVYKWILFCIKNHPPYHYQSRTSLNIQIKCHRWLQLYADLLCDCQYSSRKTTRKVKYDIGDSNVFSESYRHVYNTLSGVHTIKHYRQSTHCLLFVTVHLRRIIYSSR